MYEYRARYISNHDGDTIDLDVDLGLRVHITMRVRLVGPDGRGFNSPELNGPDSARGIAARDFATAWLRGATSLIVLTHKDSKDKYGRWLATVHRGGILDLATAMVTAGHGTWQKY